MSSAVQDLHPDSDHPVLAGLGDVERGLDQMLLGVAIPLASGDYALLLTRLERESRRLEAVKLKVMAAADRAGSATQAGFTGTDAWVAKNTTTSRADAARDVGLARELSSGGHDHTAEALDAGLVSPAHAAVIVNTDRSLPEGVSDAQRRSVEAALVEKARRYTPDQLRRDARRAVEAIEPDEAVVDAAENEQVRTEEEIARDKCALSMRDNGDGTTTGRFTIPTFTAAVLSKIIETMTAPRRMRETTAAAQPPGAAQPAGRSTGATCGQAGGHQGGQSAERSQQRNQGTGRFFDWAHRRGLAFAEILEHLPTDHLHPKSAATVVVTISHGVLQGALKAAHLDTGRQLSAGEARRVACSAGILPAVLGGGSLALDLGRLNRLFSETQRVAVGLKYETCAAEGCDRPFAWCELHHLIAWALGGRTDLINAIPLCHWHHQRIHDDTYLHQRLPDGSLRFSRLT